MTRFTGAGLGGELLLGRWLGAGIVVVALASSAGADPLPLLASEYTEHAVVELGELDEGNLSVEVHSRSTEDMSGRHEDLIVAVWRVPGRPEGRQVLGARLTGASAGAVRFSLSRGRLLARWAARVCETRSEGRCATSTGSYRWRWQREGGLFVPEKLLSGRGAKMLGAVREALERGDFEGARRARDVRQLAPGDWSELEGVPAAFWARLWLEAGVRVGKELVREGRGEEAVRVLQGAVQGLPGWATDGELPGQLRVCPRLEAATDSDWRCDVGVALPPTERNAALVNDLASILREGGRPAAAVALLRPLVALMPGQRGARLNLADSLWGAGAREEAARIYAECPGACRE